MSPDWSGQEAHPAPVLASARCSFKRAPTNFLVIGSGDAQITFSTEKPGLPVVGIESIDEQFLNDGTGRTGRRLNGDQSSQGQALRALRQRSDPGQNLSSAPVPLSLAIAVQAHSIDFAL